MTCCSRRPMSNGRQALFKHPHEGFSIKWDLKQKPFHSLSEIQPLLNSSSVRNRVLVCISYTVKKKDIHSGIKVAHPNAMFACKAPPGLYILSWGKCMYKVPKFHMLCSILSPEIHLMTWHLCGFSYQNQLLTKTILISCLTCLDVKSDILHNILHCSDWLTCIMFHSKIHISKFFITCILQCVEAWLNCHKQSW